MTIKLIVGLNNPGKDYADTRHNAGAWLVHALAERYQIRFKVDGKFKGEVGRIQQAGIDCWLLLPNTFMNASGESVAALAKFYKIERHQILIAHDELDMPPGRVKLKKAGGSGGHNGLRDSVKQLGGQDFYRLRIGIGHPGHRDRVTPYVLSKPRTEEYAAIRQAITAAVDVSSDIFADNIERAMKQLHTQVEG